MPLQFQEIDSKIAAFMQKWGEPATRASFGIIFFWFGILKPLGVSEAAPLVEATVSWMPLFTPENWVSVIGWWEVVIGITFLFHKTTRIAIGLLFLQMGGTFLPLIILPEITFQPGGIPLMPTMEGQYIIKNLLIISAALYIGGTVKPAKGREKS